VIAMAKFGAHPRCPRPRLQRGFTLAEGIIVIVVTGILASMAAVFIRAPVQAYFDTARRAQMTDIADTAVRRIQRDLQAALPNSVRLTGACNGAGACFLEYTPVEAGGRYRAELKSDGTGNPLSFTSVANQTFDVIGPAISIPAGALWVVVYNLGISGADAYSGAAAATDVRRAYSGASGNVATISITSANRLPFESPSKRFHVVSQPVTYECAAATGALRRHSGYGFNSSQALGAPSALPVLLATNVSSCNFSYLQDATKRAGLVAMNLQLTQGGETVSLFHQFHVSNVP
jgi:MSHA biogenesis protein MshO